MKKIFILGLLMFAGIQMSAQSSFGVKAGYAHVTARADMEGVSVSMGESGYYAGLLAEFRLGSGFAIQPEALYASVQEASFLYVPLMAKYFVTNSLNIQAGPQANFGLEEYEDEKGFGLDVAFGAAYAINNDFFIDARYAFELTNRYDGMGSEDIKAGYDTFMVGLGYKF